MIAWSVWNGLSKGIQTLSNINAVLAMQFTGTIEINADNTYEADMGGESDSGTWSLSADNEKLTIDSDTEPPMIFDLIEISSKKSPIFPGWYRNMPGVYKKILWNS